jgi:hypothetical protein
MADWWRARNLRTPSAVADSEIERSAEDMMTYLCGSRLRDNKEEPARAHPSVDD